MTPQQLELPVADATPAILTLPQPLTERAMQALEQALVASLAMLRRDLSGVDEPSDETGKACVNEAAGELEYRSWMHDAGALEYASWTAQLLISRR
jgi:hypothetical protein